MLTGNAIETGRSYRSSGKFGMAQGYKQHAPTELRTQ